MPESQSLRISILTPSYNQAQFIEQNIRSVMDQGYPNFEHIVVDGASSDGTISILSRYPHVKWISEADGGQGDALNKGFAMSTGDIIGWINSDDYYEPQVFHDVALRFADPGVAWIIGNLTDVLEPSGERVPRTTPLTSFDKLVRNPDIVRQPATFFRRAALLDAGPWDTALHMALDYDLWLRVARICPPVLVGRKYAYFRRHATQKTSPANAERQRTEIVRVLRRNGVSPRVRFRISLRKRYQILKSRIRLLLERSSLRRVCVLCVSAVKGF